LLVTRYFKTELCPLCTHPRRDQCLFFFIRELPRVLTLYDIDLTLEDARENVRAHFDRNNHIKDDRVVDMLVSKGYMELEETLLQHKQRSHLQRTLSGYIDQEGANRKKLTQSSSIDEQFARA